jgi:dTDP-4-amino-4,6-dideoxygalactose transaminase
VLLTGWRGSLREVYQRVATSFLETTLGTAGQVRPIRDRPLPEEYPGAHAMDDEEIEAAVRVLRSKSLFRYYGIDPQNEVTSFEAEFASYLQVGHVLAVSSGTAALHTALSTLRVGPGQEVIVPAYMWVSVVAAVINLGAIPVLAEIDETFCLDPADVRRKITPRTAGIIAVHMSGAQADAIALLGIAREHGIFLLEDCAQCVGGSVDGKKVGSFGDMAIFSFQVNKNMSSGEAGAVTTNDETLYRRAIACHDCGCTRDFSGSLLLDEEASLAWGRGCRLDELRAAVLRVQLRKLDRTIDRMRRSKWKIRRFLETQTNVRLRQLVDPNGDTGCSLITTFKTAASARKVNERLLFHSIVCSSPETSNVVLEDYGLHIYFNIAALGKKVGTDSVGTPWTLERNRDSVYEYGRGACPVADDLFGRSQLLTIPSCLTGLDEDQVIEAFQDALTLI